MNEFVSQFYVPIPAFANNRNRLNNTSGSINLIAVTSKSRKIRVIIARPVLVCFIYSFKSKNRSGRSDNWGDCSCDWDSCNVCNTKNPCESRLIQGVDDAGDCGEFPRPISSAPEDTVSSQFPGRFRTTNAPTS